MAEQKTNVMRVLSQKKIPYQAHEYPHGDSAVDGVTVAKITGLAPDIVFKTLVCRGASKSVYVFCIPVSSELDLKKAAAAVGEKSVSMIHVKDINKITGYIRGGCSPVGMKKNYVTVFDSSAEKFEKIYVSAGKLGFQMELSPYDLCSLVNGKFCEITL